MQKKIRILFLATDPSDTARLRLGAEVREIQEKLQLSQQRDRFELHQRSAVRAVDLSQALLDVQPQVVHFSGHGEASGEIFVEDPNGFSHPIDPEALAALFEQFSSHVQCVVLNACYSQSQAEVIARHIDHVIGMSEEIEDQAALAFSIGFYQSLGAGRSVPDSYALGCVQIHLQGIPGHLIPRLIQVKPVPPRSAPPSFRLQETHSPQDLDQPAPLYPFALLDRRLAMDLALLADSGTAGTQCSHELLCTAFALFDRLLIENIYSSELEKRIQAGDSNIRQSILLLDPADLEKDDETRLLLDDAARVWARDLQFKVLAARYDLTKGNNQGDALRNVRYIQDTLFFAAQGGMTIVPHPDRWPLYEGLLSHCLWMKEGSLRRVEVVPAPVPEPAGPPTTGSSFRLVRFESMPYPVPEGILRRYDRQNLLELPRSVYEFLVPAGATSGG